MFVSGSLLVAGCTMTHEEESDTRKRQRAALNDPFHYGPTAQQLQADADDDVDPTDVNGGGTTNLNKKALKRDWDALMGN